MNVAEGNNGIAKCLMEVGARICCFDHFNFIKWSRCATSCDRKERVVAANFFDVTEQLKMDYLMARLQTTVSSSSV